MLYTKPDAAPPLPINDHPFCFVLYHKAFTSLVKIIAPVLSIPFCKFAAVVSLYSGIYKLYNAFNLASCTVCVAPALFTIGCEIAVSDKKHINIKKMYFIIGYF